MSTRHDRCRSQCPVTAGYPVFFNLLFSDTQDNSTAFCITPGKMPAPVIRPAASRFLPYPAEGFNACVASIGWNRKLIPAVTRLRVQIANTATPVALISQVYFAYAYIVPFMLTVKMAAG